MAGIFVQDEDAIWPDPDIGIGPHLPPAAYDLRLSGGILMTVWGEGDLSIQREYIEPQLGIPERCLQMRASLRCAGLCRFIVHFCVPSCSLVWVLFEPLFDVGLAHPDGAADPHGGYGALRDE